MTRELPEWIGATDDTAVPQRVKLRVYDKAKGICAKCNLETWAHQYDHIVPIILGGENRESNLQVLCIPCHKAKTGLEVKLKSKVARVRKRHLGIKKPSRFACARSGKFKQKIGGGIVLR